ncbi:glutamate receptor 2-like [Portunus trituberculatus]|uniref:glutamate receptor 2-like n=1 Tax=Portunus trituberculatus TaxID=210409 RepID=UPI001E1CF9D0|nr:glutamate receptor 2-like [Portunus trituberculatus]
MLVRFVLLTCLVSVVARLRAKDVKKLPFLGGAAVIEFVDKTDKNSCPVIFVTDDSGPLSTIVKEACTARYGQRGATVFEIGLRDRNVSQRLSELVPMARQVRRISWCTTVVVVSHDPIFLVAFAESSLRDRLLVWATKLLIVTRLAFRHLENLLSAHWTFSMMNTVFLNFEGEVPKIICFGYTYLPYSQNGAKLVKVAAWTQKKGLLLNQNELPFSEKFENFYGAQVNVTALPFMPYWGNEYIRTPNGTSVIKYEGSDYHLLLAVARALNFTFRVLPSSSWAEVTSLVEERVSFIASVYHILMTVRAEKYDYTHTFEFSYVSFSMAKPHREPQWQSLYYPLAHHVWLAILGSVLLVPLTYITINHMSRKVIGRTTLLESVFLDMAGMFLAQSLPHRLPWDSSSRVLMAAWLVFALILASAYRGNLTAALTLPKYPTRPETISQLVDTVERVTIPSYGDSHYKYYKSSESPLFNALSRLMEVGPQVLEGLRGALQHNRAHLGAKRFLKYQIADKFTEVDGASRLYVGRDTLDPAASGWPIPHDAPYKPQLDRWIVVPLEAGLYEKWAEDLLATTKLRSQREQKKRQIELKEDGETKESLMALTIIHTQGAFLLLLIGINIACVAVIGEFVAARYAQVKR